MKSNADWSLRIGLKDIHNVLDSAEKSYRTCWKILRCWKENEIRAGTSLLDLQPTLGDALILLDQTYNKVIKFRDLLIQANQRRPRTSTPSHLRLLDRYATALKEAMALGRSLGDAFAWIFYRNSAEMLKKHLEHTPIGHFPTGIGGRGEIEFIRHAKAEKHFLRHHDITSFLRIGDISFVDVNSWKVTALGELKSLRNTDGHLDVTLHVISSDRKDLPQIRSVPGAIQQGSFGEKPTPSPEFKQRLKKQMASMSSTLAHHKADIKASLFHAYHTEELSSLARNLEGHKVAYGRAGQEAS